MAVAKRSFIEPAGFQQRSRRGSEIRAGRIAWIDNIDGKSRFTVEMEAIPGAHQPRWFIWYNVDGKGADFVERVIRQWYWRTRSSRWPRGQGRDIDIASKPWHPRADNANQGRNHADFLENLLKP